MRKLLLISALSILLFSCGGKETNQSIEKLIESKNIKDLSNIHLNIGHIYYDNIYIIKLFLLKFIGLLLQHKICQPGPSIYAIFMFLHKCA